MLFARRMRYYSFFHNMSSALAAMRWWFIRNISHAKPPKGGTDAASQVFCKNLCNKVRYCKPTQKSASKYGERSY